MKEQLELKINRDCKHYNWGGDGTEKRPNYPTEYGARCEFYNSFFSVGLGPLEPNCNKCEEYKK